ncbi:MAG: SAM-dependent methyltransferase [Gemmatimonadota bacterium]|nr:SAM-dependent methyltransferase [Gemmatimonadota bacterium]
MQSIERATVLLRDASSLEGAAAILRELGFNEPTFPLDPKARTALGLPPSIRDASITQGRDSLRGLALELHDVSETRETLTALANGLARHAPQFLWIVVAIAGATREMAIVCWSTTVSHTRIVSLLCNQDRLFESDAETLCALSAAAGDTDLLTHARWVDVLGREAITRRFFRTLQAVVGELADSLRGGINRAERRELALLYVSRLIFLSFLEAKGWLDGDFGFLSNGYSRCISEGGSYQRRVLEPLFFGTLNTAVKVRSGRARTFGRIPFLNGGLFARSHLEKRRRGCVFTDEAFGNAYGSLLSRYRFSAREDSAGWSEASIDPEMLGKAFEALMASDERKTSGAFYTPQALVEEVAERALDSIFPQNEGTQPTLTAPDDDRTLRRIGSIRVLDPACGSGAFLVHVLERIASMRVECGEDGSIAEVRRRVLMDSIFGVDMNPMAVWLCELRLWLSIVIESADGDPIHVVPLPNLDRHIRVGDSLAGGGFDNKVRFGGGRKLTSLRNRYMRACGPRKRTLARAMDREERDAAINVLRRERARLTAIRKELLIALRARDLFGERHHPDRDARACLADIRSRIRETTRREAKLRDGAALPFSFAAHFSDVAATGGFDLIIGNPPWVRIHQIAESSRDRLRQEFEVYRNAAWETGAESAGAGTGFAAQVDMAALFVERSCGLLGLGATLALLLPSKLWRSLAGGGVRRLLLERTDLIRLDDLSESRSAFEAAVYPSLLVCRRKAQTTSDSPRCLDASVGLRDRVVRWRCTPCSLPLDETPGSPWILLPGPARRAFDRLRRAGIPFAQSCFGRPLLGVKTGCNDAFVVRLEEIHGDAANISSGGRTAQIERAMLRPLVRGETLAAWSTTGPREYLIWPHCEDNQPLRALPPLARRWLLSFHDKLHGRSDLHGRLPWWTLFRTESASASSPRVIWADFGRAPRAIAVEAGNPIVALNTCYVAVCETLEDAHALATLLNGPLISAWVNTLAEPARGGYRRYLGWTMSFLPTPRDWNRAREQLAPLGERAMLGDVPAQDELLYAALSAYGLRPGDVQPLLSWMVPCD